MSHVGDLQLRYSVIADNTSVVRKVTRRMLESFSFRVDEAEDGTDALALCKTEMPDLVLIDWQLPGVAVKDVLAGILAVSAGKRPRILYCTTENDPLEIRRALAAGADDVLMKPFNRAELEAKLDQFQLRGS